MYLELWGEHIHHGYWIDGTESKERAQEQLIDELATRAGVSRNSRVLDAGCGIGGSAIRLAKTCGADVLGVTISPKQAIMARSLAMLHQARVQFVVMDAEELALDATFDIIWSIEALSHLNNKERFLHTALSLLAPGGRIAIVDWFKAPGLSAEDERKFIKPIQSRMLVPQLSTMEYDRHLLERLGLRIAWSEDISSRVEKTWELCAGILNNPSVWKFAFQHGPAFVSFLEGFHSMRAGFRSEAFRCGMLIAANDRGRN